MDAIEEEQSNTSLAPIMPWNEICAQYWDEWVLLSDVVDAPDGTLQSARVLYHDPSLTPVIARIKEMDRDPDTKPETALVNTAGRRVSRPPRFVFDEDGNLL